MNEKNLQHTHQFQIDSIDPLGQGVCKNSDKITFIDKVLPDESGTAVTWKENSKVRFARMTSLESEKVSPLRIKPKYSHYQNYFNCSYQHTSYDSELKFKKEAFLRMLRALQYQSTIDLIEAPERFYYRNRIQLHYDLHQMKLGFITPQTQSITEVPHCLLVRAELKQKLEELYSHQSWVQLISNQQPKTGHIELYYLDQNIQLNVNQPYAFGGFTQVNEVMNQRLKSYLLNFLEKFSPKTILDLFGGSGNLTNHYSKAKVTVVDGFQSTQAQLKDWQTFQKVDLYSKNECKNWLLATPKQDLLIVDPPRTGIKHLAEILEKTQARHFCYVSCNPSTMIRDVKELENYRCTHAALVDLFPATHHFESVTVFERIG